MRRPCYSEIPHSNPALQWQKYFMQGCHVQFLAGKAATVAATSAAARRFLFCKSRQGLGLRILASHGNPDMDKISYSHRINPEVICYIRMRFFQKSLKSWTSSLKFNLWDKNAGAESIANTAKNPVWLKICDNTDWWSLMSVRLWNFKNGGS